MTFDKSQIAAHIPTIVPDVVVEDDAAASAAALFELMADAARGRARHAKPWV
jgi:hypothetical protein